jgi:hypothetical protein
VLLLEPVFIFPVQKVQNVTLLIHEWQGQQERAS